MEPTTTAGSRTREIVVTRELDAPRELVWAAFTKPEQFVQWFGPHGATVTHCTIDVRVGGVLHFCHHVPGIADVWVKGVFDDVVAPELLGYRQYFSDAEGNIVERPGFPVESHVRIQLASLGPQTRVTVRHAGLTVDQGEGQGWSETLERLEANLQLMQAERAKDAS